MEASEALTGLVRATELQKQTAKKVIKAEAVQKQEVATSTEVQPKLKKVESKQTTETTQEAKAQAAIKRQQQRTANRARNRARNSSNSPRPIKPRPSSCASKTLFPSRPSSNPTPCSRRWRPNR